MPMPEASLQYALGEISICTSAGAVSLKDAGQIPNPSEHKPQCPCCLLGCLSSCAGGGVAIPLEAPSIAVVKRGNSRPFVLAAVDAPASHLRLTASRPRAPPALFG